MSAILDPPFRKMEIRYQIHSQRPQRLLSTDFRVNRVVSKIACLTLDIRNFAKGTAI